MDWSKAKSNLIIALIIANIFLFGLVYYRNVAKADKTLTEEFSHEVIEYLENKDIHLDTEIPLNSAKLNSLTVEFERYDAARLNNRFFNGEGKISREKTSVTTIENEDESLSIVNNRRLLYENGSTNIYFNISSDSSAISIATDFLKKRGYEISDMSVTHINKENGEYHINFSKIFEDHPVETSYTNFIVNNTGVKLMDRLWLNVLEESNTEIYTSSAPKALLSLLSMPEYYGRTIVDIQKCYYFNPEEQGYVEDITEARQGRAIPAWRIQFDNGESIGIDNY